MTDTQGRAQRPPTPSYLRVPALADQLLAALRTYVDSIDQSNPVNAAHAATIEGFLAETKPFGTDVQVTTRPRQLGPVDPARTGTEG
jgi:hypothetical protein